MAIAPAGSESSAHREQSPLDVLALADWRRRVAELYARVRRTTPPDEAWRLWREGRDELFRDHPQSPLDTATRRSLAGLPYFPYDLELRFAVQLEPSPHSRPVEMDAGADGTVRLRSAGRTRGLRPRLGTELVVFWIEGYGGGLFLPFKDATAGAGTYGGGRYLLDGVKGADLGCEAGRLILDLNFAYNPSCSYDERWVCPLAPPENVVPVAIEAGERLLRAPQQSSSPGSSSMRSRVARSAKSP